MYKFLLFFIFSIVVLNSQNPFGDCAPTVIETNFTKREFDRIRNKLSANPSSHLNRSKYPLTVLIQNKFQCVIYIFFLDRGRVMCFDCDQM